MASEAPQRQEQPYQYHRPHAPIRGHLEAAHVRLMDAEDNYDEAHQITHIPVEVWEECERAVTARLGSYPAIRGEWVLLANVDADRDRRNPNGDGFGFFYLHYTASGWERVIFLRDQYANDEQLQPKYTMTMEKTVGHLFYN